MMKRYSNIHAHIVRMFSHSAVDIGENKTKNGQSRYGVSRLPCDAKRHEMK